MKRRRLLLFGALVLGVAVLVLVWPRRPEEPVYQGRPLSQWLDGSMRTHLTAMEEGQAAREAVRALGTNALPYLVREFTHRDSAFVQRWNALLSYVGLRKYWVKSEQWRFHIATRGICLLGPDAAPALPTLALSLGDKLDGSTAAWVMSYSGAAALPFFVRASASTNLDAAIDAIRGLGYLAWTNAAAITQLVALLDHPNAARRAYAAEWLVNGKSRPDLVIPALRRALFDQSTAVQYEAVHALGKLAPASASAIPDLERLSVSSNATIATAASNAVLQIDFALHRSMR